MSNVFCFTGALGRDAEVRYLPSGQAVLSANVANNVGFGDKQQTMWISVSLWGKQAESNLKDYLKKGQQVFVSGELSTREYKANDGSMKTSLELRANTIELVGSRRENTAQSQPAYQAPQSIPPYQPPVTPQPAYVPQPAPPQYSQPLPQPTPSSFNAPYDDDIPF